MWKIKNYIISDSEVELYAHNIYVAGQMWSFRRWVLRKMFTLDEYVELQTTFLIQGAKGMKMANKETIII